MLQHCRLHSSVRRAQGVRCCPAVARSINSFPRRLIGASAKKGSNAGFGSTPQRGPQGDLGRKKAPSVTFITSYPSQNAAEAIAQAAAAAQAAQQMLFSKGPLAQELQRDNKLLRRQLETYSTVQRLFHKAMLPLAQRHCTLGTSGAGFAYSLLCEVIGNQPTKQPGDDITAEELQDLDQQVQQQLSADAANQPLAELASAMQRAVIRMGSMTEAIVIGVMPDLLSMLSLGWMTPFTTAEAVAIMEDQGMQGLLKGVVGFALSSIASTTKARVDQHVGRALVGSCQPQSTPPGPVPKVLPYSASRCVDVGSEIARMCAISECGGATCVRCMQHS